MKHKLFALVVLIGAAIPGTVFGLSVNTCHFIDVLIAAAAGYVLGGSHERSA